MAPLHIGNILLSKDAENYEQTVVCVYKVQ